MPIHSGNDRLPDVGDRGRPAGDEVRIRSFAVGQVGHFFYIGTCGEGLVGAGQDDGAGGGVGVERCESGIEFREEGCRQGIQSAGAIECDCGKAVISERSIGWALVKEGVSGERRAESVLRPTPGLGASTRIFSYLASIAEEYRRASRGRIDQDVLTANGLNKHFEAIVYGQTRRTVPASLRLILRRPR